MRNAFSRLARAVDVSPLWRVALRTQAVLILILSLTLAVSETRALLHDELRLDAGVTAASHASVAYSTAFWGIVAALVGLLMPVHASLDARVARVRTRAVARAIIIATAITLIETIGALARDGSVEHAPPPALLSALSLLSTIFPIAALASWTIHPPGTSAKPTEVPTMNPEMPPARSVPK